MASVASMWKNQTTTKLVILGILTLVLMIPVSMIDSLLWDRKDRQQLVVEELSAQWGGAAVIKAAYLSLPYEQRSNGETHVRTLYLMPELVELEGGLDPQVRRRGIYEVPVFDVHLSYAGTFKRPDFNSLDVDESQILWHQAEFILGLNDLSGLTEVAPVLLDNASYGLQAGVNAGKVVAKGLQTAIELADDWQALSFSGTLQFNASQSIQFVPLGQSTKVSLQSDWDSPSFVGQFLPKHRVVNEQGFEASWQVLGLNRNIPQLLHWQDTYLDEDALFGVKLLIQGDVYQQVERISKYAVMFLVFTFAALFCAEVITKRGIHPIQYLMVGMAAAIFYLLLLSLAEHIGFDWAYYLAAAMITLQISLYCRVLSHDARLSGFIAGLLILLYAYLYMLLQMEDFALLAGSLALVVLLAVVMYITRHIDWYGE